MKSESIRCRHTSGFISCYNPAIFGNAKKPKEDDNVIPKKPFKRLSLDGSIDRPIPEDVYPVLDTDLARDNLENDISAADLQDL